VNTLLPVALLLALACGRVASADEDAGVSDKASITGIVVDANGKPTAGVEVRNAKGSTTTRTGEDGRFAVSLNSSNVRYAVLIASDDHDASMALWEANDSDPRFLEATAEVRLVLKPSCVVKARVVDSAGAPVIGAKIAAQHAYDFVAYAESDTDGWGILRMPEDAKVTNIVAVKAGVGFDYFENKASEKWLDVKPLPSEVTLTLDGVSRFQVHAVDSKGHPIKGVEFCPWTLHRHDRSYDLNVSGAPKSLSLGRITNAEGLATFEFFPVQLKGRTPLLCQGDDWHQQEDPMWSGDVAGMSEKPVLETTLLRNGKASGLILREDGTPAAGILLQAEGRGNTNHYCRRLTRTRGDGTFQFTLSPEQSYIIAICDKDWTAPSMNGFIMREGEERTDLLFTLGKGTRVHGTVTHLKTGEPLAKKTITVIEQGAKIDPSAFSGGRRWRNKEESLVRWTETDAEGRYSIRLGAGRFQMSADYAEEDRGEFFVGDQPEMQRDFRITPRE
jgi:hypothetical protein